MSEATPPASVAPFEVFRGVVRIDERCGVDRNLQNTRQMRTRLALGALAGFALTFVALPERDASACGGCFHPPAQNVSDITDERMLLSVTPNQTTLFDQIRYSGQPSSFAWVLPIKGTVDVGLSADVMFDTIDSVTATQINPPPHNCPPPPNCGTTAGGFASPADQAGGSGGVTVTKQANVGPYETVQLHTTDPQALNTWLAQNGFEIPQDVTPIIDAYVSEGFDFLAMKLLPDQGVTAMRPVRVTFPGASLSLPLRMAAIGTGATVGISIWVVSDGRYEPQNFPFFHIDDSELVWDWQKSISNYTTLRASHEAAFPGNGWEIESSIDVNEQIISNAILNGGFVSQAGTGSGGSGASADDDYLPIGDPSGDAGADAGDAGAYESADAVRAADLAALFGGITGNVRITRIRADLSHEAMTQDLVLAASADQSELSNVRQVKNSANEPACPDYPGCGVFGSCDTSSKPTPGPGGLLATALGMFGLVLARLARARKKS